MEVSKALTHNNLTDQIQALTDYIVFEKCPVCNDSALVRMPQNWQEQEKAIAIVGCGNPWHYCGIE